MAEFSALYYPYMTIESLDVLKRALLTFDRLYVIYPSSQYGGLMVRRPDGRDPHNGDEAAYQLINEGVMQIVPPSYIVGKYGRLMANCCQDDLADPGFHQGGVERYWDLYREKIPDFVLDQLPDIMPFARIGSDDTIRLPYAVGVSIMLSHAVFASIEKGLIPVTDDPVQQRFLDVRLTRGLRSLRSSIEPGGRGEEERLNLGKLIPVADKVMNIRIPDASHITKELTIREILDFRRSEENLLKRYRQGVASMTSAYQQHINDPEVYQILDEIVEDSIRPAYEELRRIHQGLPPFAISHTRDAESTAIGASYNTIIGASFMGGKPMTLAAVSGREPSIARDLNRRLLKGDALGVSLNLNSLLHV